MFQHPLQRFLVRVVCQFTRGITIKVQIMKNGFGVLAAFYCLGDLYLICIYTINSSFCDFIPKDRTKVVIKRFCRSDGWRCSQLQLYITTVIRWNCNLHSLKNLLKLIQYSHHQTTWKEKDIWQRLDCSIDWLLRKSTPLYRRLTHLIIIQTYIVAVLHKKW